MDPLHVNGYAEYAVNVNVDPYIHYRPAGRLAELARSYRQHDIQLGFKGKRANMKQLHEIVQLQVQQYDQVSLLVSTSVPGYEDVAESLAKKLENVDGTLNFEPRTNPPIRVGFIGTGQYAINGMMSHALGNSYVRVSAIASASPADQKQDLLRRFSVSPEKYFQMNGTVPDDFLDNVDAVYVSTPAALHYSHLTQVRRAGKYVMVEKPVVATRIELKKVIDEFGYRDPRIIPIVHYLAKPVSEYFFQHLHRKLGGRPIRKIDAILFEEEGKDNLDGDRLRRLISTLGGGGQERDTGTHLNAVIGNSAGVQLMGCLESEMYEVYPDLPFETGAFARYVGEGPQHEDVLVNTWVAKGTPKGSSMKKVVITADDMIVEGDFMTSRVRVIRDGAEEYIECKGQDPHDLLLKRTVAGIYAEHAGESAMPLRMGDVNNAHDAVDMAYDYAGGLEHLHTITDKKRISSFIDSGLKAGTVFLSK